MRIAVCDDEKEIREMLGEKVRRLYPEAAVLLYSSGEELLQEGSQPDILLLDIQMAGKTGMETAREFRKVDKDTILIFVTALEEYVFQAFNVGAFHYLVKPFEDRKFEEILRKAVSEHEDRKRREGDSPDRQRASLMIGKELLMLWMPSFLGIIGYKVMWYYRDFFIAETGKISNIYDLLLLLYYTVTFAAIVAVIVLYQTMKAGQEERLQNELLAAQIENTEKHIEQVENLYQNIRSMKHDMTNHIITLERLYAGNQEEAKDYSEKLRRALSEAAGRINSGNPVTDVILQEMQNKAEQRQIDFKIDFHYPAGSSVNAFDISVILNNALQNALEYSDQNHHSSVSVLSYRRNNAYMIEVSNSFTGSLRWDAEGGLPITSKEKIRGNGADQVHGYGLANIRRVALEYAGDIAIDVKDGRFCLSVLLMMEA